MAIKISISSAGLEVVLIVSDITTPTQQISFYANIFTFCPHILPLYPSVPNHGSNWHMVHFFSEENIQWQMTGGDGTDHQKK